MFEAIERERLSFCWRLDLSRAGLALANAISVPEKNADTRINSAIPKNLSDSFIFVTPCVVLVVNLADQFLQNILNRNYSENRPVLVLNNSEVAAVVAHFG